MKKALLTLSLLLVYAQLFSQNPGGVNGELALRALQKSFPDKTGAISFTGNEWTISAGGITFYWADGRLLPKTLLDKSDSYGPYFFYVVPANVTPPESYSSEFIESLRMRGNPETRRERKDSYRGFQAVLYGGLEKAEIEKLIENIVFLGKTIRVHRDITGALRRVDEAIRKWNGAENFIASVGSIEGYSWRPILGTQRMSYHSWGLALDIQPKRLEGKAIYWLWERDHNKDWMLVPLENRWNPPDTVIAAFEKEGFIWGGKWPVYDNMHFEYRPELHEYTRLIKY